MHIIYYLRFIIIYYYYLFLFLFYLFFIFDKQIIYIIYYLRFIIIYYYYLLFTITRSRCMSSTWSSITWIQYYEILFNLNFINILQKVSNNFDRLTLVINNCCPTYREVINAFTCLGQSMTDTISLEEGRNVRIGKRAATFSHTRKTRLRTVYQSCVLGIS